MTAFKFSSGDHTKTATLVCERCNKEYEVRYDLRKTSRFCSNLCSQLARKHKTNPPIKLICEWCGEEFEVAYRRRKTNRRYCGQVCASRGTASIKAGTLEDKGFHDLETGSHLYAAAHYKVHKEKSKKFRCTVCHKKRGTQWAYLGGNPFNVDNFVEMCGFCHVRFDRRRVAVIGLCNK